MEEIEQDDTATDPTETGADEPDPESQPASDPPPGQGDDEGKEHDLEFDPDQIQADPAYNPDGRLKDLKGA